MGESDFDLSMKLQLIGLRDYCEQQKFSNLK